MGIKRSGFALIEVVIAIVILSVVLAGATSLIWSAATAVERNQNRLTATYLAQECLELARNARDSAWRKHLPWDCAFTNNCSGAFPLVQDMIDGENLILILGTSTKFNRKMEMDASVAGSIGIKCAVSWPLRSGTERLVLNEILTNWKQL